MSDGDRSDKPKTGLIATIIVAALTIAAYWWLFYDAGYQSGQNERKANVEGAHYAADTADQINRKCSTKTGDSARECIAEIVKSERESQHRESDLAAQLEAANWAKWAGIAALAQLIATVIGLYLLKGTLDATWKAVKDTGDATVAMKEANSIALSSAEKQLRPYVYVEHVTPEIPTPETRMITICFKNFGQTPAKEIRLQLGYLCCPTDADDWPVLAYNAMLGRDIAPGHGQKATIDLPEDWATAICAGDEEIRIVAFLTFGGVGVGHHGSNYTETLQTQMHYGRNGAVSSILETGRNP